jgi:hypothetical protein
MRQWRWAGERLILCLDANKNIYLGKLGRELMDLHGLGMKEVMGEFTTRQLGTTYFRGSMPIDAVWATSDVAVVNACVMPVGYGVGDHRLFVMDFFKAQDRLLTTNCPTRPMLSEHKDCGVCSAIHQSLTEEHSMTPPA